MLFLKFHAHKSLYRLESLKAFSFIVWQRSWSVCWCSRLKIPSRLIDVTFFHSAVPCSNEQKLFCSKSIVEYVMIQSQSSLSITTTEASRDANRLMMSSCSKICFFSEHIHFTFLVFMCHSFCRWTWSEAWHDYMHWNTWQLYLIVLLRHNRCEDLYYFFSAVSKLEMYLHESARRNQTDLLTKIINKRNINLDCRNQLDRTALHMAVSHGNLSAVEQLVRAKATVEVTDKVRQVHAW